MKLLKQLWDSIGTEFGGRHELYEINYGGSTEEIRRYVLFGAQALDTADRLKEPRRPVPGPSTTSTAGKHRTSSIRGS